MCGIIGYLGPQEAMPIILDGLKRLEYRGYDSAGMAVIDGEHRLAIRRSVGKLKELENLCGRTPSMVRWGSAIPVGPRTGGPLRPMPIPTGWATSRWCITALSRTIWNSRKS